MSNVYLTRFLLAIFSLRGNYTDTYVNTPTLCVYIVYRKKHCSIVRHDAPILTSASHATNGHFGRARPFYTQHARLTVLCIVKILKQCLARKKSYT